MHFQGAALRATYNDQSVLSPSVCPHEITWVEHILSPWPNLARTSPIEPWCTEFLWVKGVQ